MVKSPEQLKAWRLAQNQRRARAEKRHWWIYRDDYHEQFLKRLAKADQAIAKAIAKASAERAVRKANSFDPLTLPCGNPNVAVLDKAWTLCYNGTSIDVKVRVKR